MRSRRWMGGRACWVRRKADPAGERQEARRRSVCLTAQEGRNIKQLLFFLAGLQPVSGVRPRTLLWLQVSLRLHCRRWRAPQPRFGAAARWCRADRFARLRPSCRPADAGDAGDERTGLAQAEAAKAARRCRQFLTIILSRDRIVIKSRPRSDAHRLWRYEGILLICRRRFVSLFLRRGGLGKGLCLRALGLLLGQRG